MLKLRPEDAMPDVCRQREAGSEAVNNTSGYHMSAGCGGGGREGGREEGSKGRRPIIDDAVW